MDQLIENDSYFGIAKNSSFNFSNSSIQTLLSSLTIGVIIFEPIKDDKAEIIDFECIFCNKLAEIPFSKPLIGTTLLNMFPESKAAGRFEAYSNVINSGIPYKCELEIVLPNHATWVQLYVSAFDNHLLISMADIQSQHNLKDSEELYRFLSESIPHIVYTCTPNGDIEYANSKWADYFGQSSLMKADYYISNFIHSDDQNYARDCWREIIKDRKEIKYVNRILGKGGEYRWFQTRVVPWKNDDGTVLKWFCTGTDIHDEKIFLDELRKTKDDLENKNIILQRLNADLDSFVYTASHDLTAPIANLSGLADLISTEQEGLSAEQQHYLDLMQQSIVKLQTTIFDLTRMILVETEKDLIKQEVFFENLYNDIRADLKGLIEKNNATITFNFQVESIRYAKKNLRSIMFNLINNAVKYRFPGRDLHIHVSTYDFNNKTILTVIDNGLGIPQKQQSKIFDIFNRLQPHIQGSGYGLYMIKRIVENNGGHIDVESEANIGSSFHVFFK